MDFTIVKRQIITEYINLYGSDQPDSIWSLEACIDVFRYYYRQYYRVFGEEHPRLSNSTIRRIIEDFPYLWDDDMERGFDANPDMYPAMIDRYFQQEFVNCDYSIAHFMSGKIRTLRFFEELY